MIKAVVFDIGGVLVDYDMPANITLLAKQLNVEEATIEQIFFENLMVYPHLAALPEEAFWKKMSDQFHLPRIPREQVLIKTYQQTATPNSDMLAFVDFLSQKEVELVTLSNTIAAHVVALTEMNVFRSFTHKIFSYEVGMRKPDLAIFTHTLTRIGLKANEVVFIDDAEENIAAAQAVGMHSILAKHTAQVKHDVLQVLTQEQGRVASRHT